VRVTIAVAVCVVIHDDRDPLGQAVACRNPLDDLIERLRQEMQHGRGSIEWREPYGAQVA